MLEIRDLRTGYDKLEVLHNVAFTVPRDKPTVVMGANAAGKTTLCKTITGLIPSWSGSIRFEGRSIEGASTAERVELGITLVPEGRQIFNEMTVKENLRLGAFIHGEPRKEDYEKIYSLFPILFERTEQHAGLLSGGEQQMLALARALMSRPRLLLLDEPSQGLAPKAIEQVVAAIDVIARSGVSILLVEQNLWMAKAIAEHTVVLETGHCIAEGPAHEIMDSDTLQNSYLGKRQET
jgi:branched-chain amino acid transport system ATP-binding protein